MSVLASALTRVMVDCPSRRTPVGQVATPWIRLVIMDEPLGGPGRLHPVQYEAAKRFRAAPP
jgi:hypothetical protein